MVVVLSSVTHSPGAEVGPVCNQMSPHFDS